MVLLKLSGKENVIKRGLILLLVILSTGCASTNLKYPVNKDAYQPASTFPYKVVISSFEDKRPEEERDPNIGHERIGYYSNDKSFRGNVGMLVANSLATHMIGTHLFHEVSVRELDRNLENHPGQMATLNREGYDLAILGTVAHCVGYYLTDSPPITEFGLVGAIYDTTKNKRTVGSYAQYFPVKVIDLKHQKVILEDKYQYQHEEAKHIYDTPYKYAEQGVREVNNRFIKELETVLKKFQAS